MSSLIEDGATTAQAYKFLRPAGEVTLPASTDPFDSYQYLQTRKGLHVSSSFTRSVLSAAQPMDGFPEITVSSFDLAKPASDPEIRSGLPKAHVFKNASEFCAVLAKMIDQQPNGGECNLLSNGDWSIFYFRGVNGELYTVFIYWHSATRSWDVYARPLSGQRWNKGSRVFFRN